jgi:glycine/D-amino acid oxidase-like deaminating enzyme
VDVSEQRVIVAGAGVYGLTAALELRQRGYAVTLLDPGPLPHPLAASTDISKLVRMDYGPDEDYLVAMEEALARWRRWNAEWPEPLFHETGLVFLTSAPMAPGGYEHDSWQLALAYGHCPERLDSQAIRQRFPAWNADRYVDGYFNPEGGYAQSGRVVGWLAERVLAAGVELRAGQTFERLLEQGSRVGGVLTRDGSRFEGEHVVLALGSWTPHMLPWTRGFFRSTGMPVFHLRPAKPELFAAERFPGFCADVTDTGYYGFPLHPIAGVVKIANHGDGREMAPDAPERAVTKAETQQLRAFLKDTFPALATAEIVFTRVCLYCDTWDGHFWIAPDPERDGLVLATGDSGHGFKFAPLLGEWIADAVQARPSPILKKFRWRPEVHPPRGEEAARYQPGSVRVNRL